MFDLSGKRAFVTGASSGLGTHFAKVLAKAGATVIIGARRTQMLAELTKELGPDALAVPLDVQDRASVSHALDQAGDVDILVNNAGITNTKPVLDQTADDWNSIIDTNLTGGFWMATEVARRMRTRGSGGSIINIASIIGVRQGGQVTPYAVSKAAVIQMTKQMALELARDDIRVNAIAPGYFETELNDDFFASDPGKALIRRIPQRRLGRLEDLDAPLLLLAANASPYMTGSVLVVDGGHLLSSL
ncbi:SDR family NAD(P)-dependent oxidoreductase [Sphingobium mellinum]|uniref:SDR family NAD(P)-dependent oxidoreductase n=1 Tax=Sphingobium mellinum TaxID=1387166 RepID=UPI0030EEE4AB